MIQLSCHCGQITVEISKRPDFIHECNCSLCTASGAQWGYFHPSEVTVSDETTAYSRRDKAEAGAAMQFCPTCGTTTHFTLTEEAQAKHGNVVLGVNLRLAEQGGLAGIELRYPDGKSWPGEGEFAYLRDAWVIGS